MRPTLGSLTRLHNLGLVLLQADFRGLCPNIGEFYGVNVFCCVFLIKKIPYLLGFLVRPPQKIMHYWCAKKQVGGVGFYYFFPQILKNA